MKLILGSKSPRRKELLTQLGYSFEIRTEETDEIYPEETPLSEIPLYIAKLKAKELLPRLAENEILLTADTVVILENEMLGKPHNFKNAQEMLARLSGKTHTVITAFCLFTQTKEVTKSVRTEVKFKLLSADEINHYLEHFKPFDKAGSYGIQDWIGLIGIERIQGSYSNVVGLPTAEVHELLKLYPIDK